MARITVEQYKALEWKKRISKKDLAMMEKWLTPFESEDRIQEKIVKNLITLEKDWHVQFFTHIPNSTFTRFEWVKAKNKRLWTRPGMPDLFIIHSDWILCMELKKEDWKVSQEQKEVLRLLQERWISISVSKWYKMALDHLLSVVCPEKKQFYFQKFDYE